MPRQTRDHATSEPNIKEDMLTILSGLERHMGPRAGMTTPGSFSNFQQLTGMIQRLWKDYSTVQQDCEQLRVQLQTAERGLQQSQNSQALLASVGKRGQKRVEELECTMRDLLRGQANMKNVIQELEHENNILREDKQKARTEAARLLREKDQATQRIQELEITNEKLRQETRAKIREASATYECLLEEKEQYKLARRRLKLAEKNVRKLRDSLAEDEVQPRCATILSFINILMPVKRIGEWWVKAIDDVHVLWILLVGRKQVCTACVEI